MTSDEEEELARQLTLPAPDLSGPVSGLGTLYLGDTRIADVSDIELNVARPAIGGIVNRTASQHRMGALSLDTALNEGLTSGSVQARVSMAEGSARALRDLGGSAGEVSARLRDFGTVLQSLNPSPDSAYAHLQRMVSEEIRASLRSEAMQAPITARGGLDAATIESLRSAMFNPGVPDLASLFPQEPDEEPETPAPKKKRKIKRNTRRIINLKGD